MVSFNQNSKGQDKKLTACIAKGGSYGAISALVNIPATMLGATIYELFLVDSDRGKKLSVVPKISGS